MMAFMLCWSPLALATAAQLGAIAAYRDVNLIFVKKKPQGVKKISPHFARTVTFLQHILMGRTGQRTPESASPVAQASRSGECGTLKPERDAREGNMKPSRLAFYIILALVTTAAALFALNREPEPGCPINLVHLLCNE
jgi:hypothetical protein